MRATIQIAGLSLCLAALLKRFGTHSTHGCALRLSVELKRVGQSATHVEIRVTRVDE